MSYDRIRIRTDQQPSGSLERRQATTMGLSEQFELTYNRLYTQGHYVVLVAGKNYCFDELFLFEIDTDAQEFYDRGFHDWESFIGDDNEGCGFQEVSLYQGGRRGATRTCEPTGEWGLCNMGNRVDICDEFTAAGWSRLPS